PGTGEGAFGISADHGDLIAGVAPLYEEISHLPLDEIEEVRVVYFITLVKERHQGGDTQSIKEGELLCERVGSTSGGAYHEEGGVGRGGAVEEAAKDSLTPRPIAQTVAARVGLKGALRGGEGGEVFRVEGLSDDGGGEQS